MGKLSLSDKAGFITAGRFLRAASKLFMSIIIVRLLSQFEYGTYRQVFLLYSLFSVIFVLGIPMSLYYFIPKADEEKKKILIIQSEALLFGLGFLLGIGFWISAPYWAKAFSNNTMPPFLKWFSLYPLFDLPVLALPPILICYNKHKQAAFFNVIISFVFILSLLIPIVLGVSFFNAFKIMIFVAGLQFVVIAFYLLRLIGGVVRQFDLPLMKTQLAYSIPLSLSGVVAILSRELDKLVISFFFTPDKFAVYSVGAKELPLVTILPYAVSSTLFPRFVAFFDQNAIEDFKKTWHEAIRKVSVILLPLIPICFVLSKEIIGLLYTDQYADCIPLFRVYLLLLLIHVTAFDSVVLSMGLSKTVLYISFGALFMNFVMNIFSIQIFGFIGPAIATVTVSVFITAYYIYVICREKQIHLKDVLPWKLYGLVLSAALISGLPIYLLAGWEPGYFFKIVVFILIYGIVYAALLSLLKVLNPADMALLKRWLSLNVLKSE